MKAIIDTISPNGNAIRFETPEEPLEELLKHLPALERKLEAAGYMANAERHYPKTPSGEPICPKHMEVMDAREKQGDHWFSHKVLGENGQPVMVDGKPVYCRGHAGKLSPGWSY